jgi:hypothetical protein
MVSNLWCEDRSTTDAPFPSRQRGVRMGQREILTSALLAEAVKIL